MCDHEGGPMGDEGVCVTMREGPWGMRVCGTMSI